jgi:RNA polymerase sigma-70 factor (ECF subfamily)
MSPLDRDDGERGSRDPDGTRKVREDREPKDERLHPFPTTHWSLVLDARGRSGAEARTALAELCRVYWYPIYAFIRLKGHNANDAEELTQSYFARLLVKDVIDRADRCKGRFRTFLRTDCRNFLIDLHRRQIARYRRVSAISIDLRDAEGRYLVELADTLTPEQKFDRLWAITLLDRALKLLSQEYESKGRAKVFDLLKPVLVEDELRLPVSALAAQLEKSEAAIYTAVHRLRRRYGEILLSEVAATLGPDSSPEEEIQMLFDALRPRTCRSM